MFTSQFGHKLQEVVRWRCLINLAGASVIESISPMPVIKFAMMEQPEITWKRGCFLRSPSERLARPSTCRWSQHLCPQSDRGWQWGWSFEDYLGINLGKSYKEKRCFLRSRHSLCERFAPHSSASSLFMGGGGGGACELKHNLGNSTNIKSLCL